MSLSSGILRPVTETAWRNQLYYGDNLEVMREHIAPGTIDLVYLDPPFNSNRNYNVIFGKHLRSDNGDAAQIQAFGDTWTWTPATDDQYTAAVNGGVPGNVADALVAMRVLLTENDAMAYLVNMAPRLVELYRVMKPTGSLYLHCDPTMSHYLKVILDAIFGAENFLNEIVWKRTNARSTGKRWPRVHDVLLMYAKGRQFYFRPQKVAADAAKMPHTLITGADGKKYQTYELTGQGVTAEGASGKPWRGFDPSAMGRHWANSPETMNEWDSVGLIHWPARNGFPRRRDAEPFDEASRVVTVADIWTDVDRLNQTAAERLGYPTQKPLALLERIISASSKEDDIVLDPFCGCGTTVDAAQRLDRRWIGIDVTYIAIDLIEKRLQHTFGQSISETYTVYGIPRDLGGAHALFKHSPFDFERWVVSLIGAQPNQKQVGDKGVDGVARFHTDSRGTIGRLLVSVKGGRSVTPQFVRDLVGTVQTQKAQMGVLITMTEPTRGILDAVNHGGTYVWPVNDASFPRIQVITVDALLRGERPRTPSLLLPYIAAAKAPGKAWIQDVMPSQED